MIRKMHQSEGFKNRDLSFTQTDEFREMSRKRIYRMYDEGILKRKAKPIIKKRINDYAGVITEEDYLKL